MKKGITPLIYFFFLFPLTAIAIGTEFVAREIGLLPEYSGVIEVSMAILMLGALLILGIPLLWLANRLMQKIENLKKTTTRDHFRQSIFFYLAGVYSLASWGINGFGNTEEDGYLLLWLAISIIAVVVNYSLLIKKK